MRWWQFNERDKDLEREFSSDLELEEEELRAKGYSAEEAHRAARRAFGNATLIREQVHESWGWAAWERLSQDVRYAVRQLFKSPGFSIVAAITLALGIGATTAIFTLVYGVMLRPLPFPQAERLVTMQEVVAEWSNIYPVLPVSANHFTFWHQHHRSFDAMAVMQLGALPLGTGGRPSQIGVLLSTPEIFSVLQVQPQLGRAFTVEEAQPGNDHVAVLTYDLWRAQFDNDGSIIGKTIRLNGFPYTVIGVMPESFRMPSVETMATPNHASRALPVGVIAPLSFSKDRLAEQMGDLNYFGLARLKPGVSVAAATADLNALQHTISAGLPANDEATLSVLLTPFQEQLVGSNRRPLVMLLAAVAGLLLVGCVNVTNLLLARAVGKKQQMAIASALGARRSELVRMAIRESAVLAVAGGLLGVLLASVMLPAMRQYLPSALDFRGPLHLDWAGAGCALLLAGLATLLSGAAPAFMVSATAPNEVLHSEARLASESRGSRRARRVLVSVEVALSVALVLMTGLLTASVMKLIHTDTGFTTERTVTATINLPIESYRNDHSRMMFLREVLDRMVRLPGVEHAAITSVLPLAGDSWGDSARILGDARPDPQLPLESFRWVSPEYFAAIHLPLLSGSYFTQGDWGKNMALISEKTAKTLWPGKDPVGRQFMRGDPSTEKPFTVVGVVANARTISLAQPDPMLIYVPYWYRCDPTSGLVVRTHQVPSDMAESIRQTIWSVDHNVPVPTVQTLGSLVTDSIANQRFEMDLLLMFAMSAMFLAGLGIYGVTAYSVVQRRREIAVRIALGAQRANIYWLVLRESLLPVAIGAAAGIATAFAGSRLIGSLLFDVSPYDPSLAAGAVCILLTIGIAACLLPARRAAWGDPMEALRSE